MLILIDVTGDIDFEWSHMVFNNIDFDFVCENIDL